MLGILFFECFTGNYTVPTPLKMIDLRRVFFKSSRAPIASGVKTPVPLRSFKTRLVDNVLRQIFCVVWPSCVDEHTNTTNTLQKTNVLVKI